MSASLRSVLLSSSPIAALATLPRCANPLCPRPPSLWQRWWARREGRWLEENWYCSSDCFYCGLVRRLDDVGAAGRRRTPRLNRLPLGLILLSQGDITAEQLRRALERQRSAGKGKIGEWLVEMGAVAEEQVTNALAAQQGCPVFAPREPQSLPAAMHWPQPLTETYCAAPVFYNPAQSALYVGFLEGVDHTFLNAVEQMLQCRTDPCIVPPALFRRYLRHQAAHKTGETIVIRQRQDSFEMAQAIDNYAQQVRAGRCALTLCGGHLWIRLSCADGFHVDFLFRAASGH